MIPFDESDFIDHLSFKVKMSNHKAQDFLEKEKEETKEAKKGEVDTSKMPEGLRKHFEKKGKKVMADRAKVSQDEE